jgi:hypothetical protein
MHRHLRESWLARHMLRLRPGGALALLSTAGTLLALLLWLEVSVTAAAMTYALTLGAVLLILRRHARAEAREAKRTHETVGNDHESAGDRRAKKIVSSR